MCYLNLLRNFLGGTTEMLIESYMAFRWSVANTPMRNRLSPFLLYLPTTWILQPLRAYLRAYLRAHFEDIRTIHIATPPRVSSDPQSDSTINRKPKSPYDIPVICPSNPEKLHIPFHCA